VPLRSRFARTVAGTLIVLAALVSVGLTAPADAPFRIGVHAVFFGLDVEIRLGAQHWHLDWSVNPLNAPTTKPASTLL
jgi:hypothetical protein